MRKVTITKLAYCRVPVVAPMFSACSGCLNLLFFVMCSCFPMEASDGSVRKPQIMVHQSLEAVNRDTNRDLIDCTNQSRRFPNALEKYRNYPDVGSIPTLARICTKDNKEWTSVWGFCHLLHFYGLGPNDLSSLRSSDLFLKPLIDEAAAIEAFGKSPFVRTRNGLRYYLSADPVFHTDVGESHQDACLAIFAELNLPLDTPIKLESRSYAISDLLSESIANFNFDQKELAWTALAYSKYIPQKKEWINRFRERISFSEMVRHLIRRGFNTESCAGTHVFQALVRIDQADRHFSILDEKTRKELNSFLATTLDQVVQRQQPDGSWNRQWCGVINEDIGTRTTFRISLLVTGHLFDVVLNSLDSRLRPSSAVYVRGTEWLRKSLSSTEIRFEPAWICPLTHAIRAVRETEALKANESY